jgi:hypothetical protein
VIPRAADREGWCKHRNTDHDEPFGADIAAGGHWPSSARDSVSTGKHDFGRRGTGRFLSRGDLAVAQVQVGQAQAQAVVPASALDSLAGKELVAPAFAQHPLAQAQINTGGRPALGPGQVKTYWWLYNGPRLAMTLRPDYRRVQDEVRLHLAELRAAGTSEADLLRAQELYAGLTAERLDDERL